jgi:hypothetical protein
MNLDCVGIEADIAAQKLPAIVVSGLLASSFEASA